MWSITYEAEFEKIKFFIYIYNPKWINFSLRQALSKSRSLFIFNIEVFVSRKKYRTILILLLYTIMIYADSYHIKKVKYQNIYKKLLFSWNARKSISKGTVQKSSLKLLPLILLLLRRNVNNPLLFGGIFCKKLISFSCDVVDYFLCKGVN